MEVRAEKPEEIEVIHRVNVAAFGRESEADLVDRLRGIASTFSFLFQPRRKDWDVSTQYQMRRLWYWSWKVADWRDVWEW